MSPGPAASPGPTVPDAAPGLRRWLPGKLTSREQAELRHALLRAEALSSRAGDLLSRFLVVELVDGALSAMRLDELLQRLVALATETLGADRGTVFLRDEENEDLVAVAVQGGDRSLIRIPRASGIAGAVLGSGRSQIVADAYAHPQFNPAVDQRTGYRTRSLICAPLRCGDNDPMGAFEILNKRSGQFDQADLALLEAIAIPAAIAIDRAYRIEALQEERERDRQLIELADAIAAELQLDRLLEAIVGALPLVLGAERATLFLYDPAAGELVSRTSAGGRIEQIRLPTTSGLAGACFTARQRLNVPDAHADPRFYPGIDEHSGFITGSLLCVPIVEADGSAVGVLEALNKRQGRFTAADERRLGEFARRAAVALRNAQRFGDVVSLKVHTDNLLRSMSDGLVTLGCEFEIKKVNDAARHLLRLADGVWLAGSALDLWGDDNPWLGEGLAYVRRTGATDHRPDVALVADGREIANVEATIAASRDGDGRIAGYTLLLRDIGRQKKTHAVMTRYMAKEFAERIMASDSDAAARAACSATVLFADIRRFTSITEKLTAEAAVDLLNEYFSQLAEVVPHCGGAVDKFLGDGLMAVFGAPAVDPENADHALDAAAQMGTKLGELNRLRAQRGEPPLAIGIGLASGDIVAGPVGSASRLDFTVIGDAVNLAARLESATKQYRISVLVAGDTVARLSRPRRLRPIDLIRVKGRDAPTEVFQLLEGCAADDLPHLSDLLPVYEEGVRRYRERAWSAALEQFRKAVHIAPLDGPSWVYTDRCLYYCDHPPPAHWDGVWQLQTK